jgi:hypothetical protein
VASHRTLSSYLHKINGRKPLIMTWPRFEPPLFWNTVSRDSTHAKFKELAAIRPSVFRTLVYSTPAGFPMVPTLTDRPIFQRRRQVAGTGGRLSTSLDHFKSIRKIHTLLIGLIQHRKMPILITTSLLRSSLTKFHTIALLHYLKNY